MDSQSIKLTPCFLKQINAGKRKKAHVEQWLSKASKLEKDRGDGYIGRTGKENQPRLPPLDVVVCRTRCTKAGCLISIERKREIFEQYWETGSYDAQSTILAMHLDIEDVKERTRDPELSRRSKTTRYYLRNAAGLKLECCVKTFQNVFAVTDGRLRTVLTKLAKGKINLNDQRGNNSFNPREHDPVIRERMLTHIGTLPRQLSHYSRQDGDALREYLSPELSIKKMFDLFIATEEGRDFVTLEWMYREVFKDQNLRIGTPRSDTCATCDRNFIALSGLDPNDENDARRIANLELESMNHHHEADVGYAELRNDSLRSRIDANYVVICVDLQAMYQLPQLTCSTNYYLRKFSCLNFAIYEASNEDTTMSFWTQRDGARGAEEIFSCVLKFIRNKFQLLVPGEERNLIIWSDRCCGQNNNFLNILGYRYLIACGYFTSVSQILTMNSIISFNYLFLLLLLLLFIIYFLKINTCCP